MHALIIHQFSDAARLLNFYQLWLDDLFPRAKFADGLAMIEKLGHSKRLQTMRREWIEDEHPKTQSADDDSVLATKLPDMISEIGTRLNDATGTSSNQPNSTGHELQSEIQRRPKQPPSAEDSVGNRVVPEEYSGVDTAGQDAPDDDELDALLREEEEENMATTESALAGSKTSQGYADDFEFMDDLDVI